jgi:hypothetical protein
LDLLAQKDSVILDPTAHLPNGNISQGQGSTICSPRILATKDVRDADGLVRLWTFVSPVSFLSDPSGMAEAGLYKGMHYQSLHGSSTHQQIAIVSGFTQ